MSKINKIQYSIFKNGLKMKDLSRETKDLSSYFFSDWEANRFMESAFRQNLISLEQDKTKDYIHCLLYQKDLPENKTVISIDCFEDGTICKINHKKS